MMKLQRDMPTEEDAQFVVLWEFSDKIWTDTCKIVNGHLLVYMNHIDEFEISKYTSVWQDEKRNKDIDIWFMVKK